MWLRKTVRQHHFQSVPPKASKKRWVSTRCGRARHLDAFPALAEDTCSHCVLGRSTQDLRAGLKALAQEQHPASSWGCRVPTKPLGLKMQLAITSCLRNWLANYTGSVNKILCIHHQCAVSMWHFLLSKRNTWKTRITANITKGNKSQKTPVSLSLPLPVASPWLRFCSKRVPFKGHWPHFGNEYLLFKRNEYQPFPFANEIARYSETSESVSFKPSFQEFSSSQDKLQVLQLSTSLIGSG